MSEFIYQTKDRDICIAVFLVAGVGFEPTALGQESQFYDDIINRECGFLNQLNNIFHANGSALSAGSGTY